MNQEHQVSKAASLSAAEYNSHSCGQPQIGVLGRWILSKDPEDRKCQQIVAGTHLATVGTKDGRIAADVLRWKR